MTRASAILAVANSFSKLFIAFFFCPLGELDIVLTPARGIGLGKPNVETFLINFKGIEVWIRILYSSAQCCTVDRTASE